jgi:hypothetical protein
MVMGMGGGAGDLETGEWSVGNPMPTPRTLTMATVRRQPVCFSRADDSE